MDIVRNIFLNLCRRGIRRYQRFQKQSARKKMVFYSGFILPVVFFWYELIFRTVTTRDVFRYGLILTLLFSCGWGILFNLLCGLFKRPKINRRIRMAIIGITAIPFLIEYFVYREFKTMYSVSTVLNGANDVAGGFMDQAAAMIFSPSGLLVIFLLLLPLILYIVFGSHFDPARQAKKRKRINGGLSLLVIWLITLLLMSFSSAYRLSYSKQYDFESAVSNFGLLTGIRLDIKRGMTGSKNAFETTNAVDTTAEAAESAAEGSSAEGQVAEEVIDRSPNVMNIDFAALAETDEAPYADIDSYVASLTPSCKNEYTGMFEGKNLIFITAEAFCAEVIDEQRTPTLYRMATKGINFTDYYQLEIAGTTGGEYQNLFGMITTQGDAMLVAANNYNPYILGMQLNNLNYYGAAYHNNDYDYYDRDISHNKLGYSAGYTGYGNGLEQYLDAVWPESDLQMLEGTLPTYINQQPFNIYYMTVSGHSDYSTMDNTMTYWNWESVENLDYSDRVKSYLAANMEFEKAMAYLVNALEEAGIADDTVIVISADHYPYGLDSDSSYPYLSELYGYEINNLFDREHNRLIIWSGCLEDDEPIIVDSPTESMDILPTLLNLFGLDWDSRLLPGRDVLSDAEAIAYTSRYDWKTDKGTYIASTDTFTPVDPNETVTDEYISRIQSIVRNKISYASSVLENDYFGHLHYDLGVDFGLDSSAGGAEAAAADGAGTDAEGNTTAETGEETNG